MENERHNKSALLSITYRNAYSATYEYRQMNRTTLRRLRTNLTEGHL